MGTCDDDYLVRWSDLKVISLDDGEFTFLMTPDQVAAAQEQETFFVVLLN